MKLTQLSTPYRPEARVNVEPTTTTRITAIRNAHRKTLIATSVRRSTTSARVSGLAVAVVIAHPVLRIKRQGEPSLAGSPCREIGASGAGVQLLVEGVKARSASRAATVRRLREQ